MIRVTPIADLHIMCMKYWYPIAHDQFAVIGMCALFFAPGLECSPGSEESAHYMLGRLCTVYPVTWVISMRAFST